jgi:hypothetical protein
MLLTQKNGELLALFIVSLLLIAPSNEVYGLYEGMFYSDFFSVGTTIDWEVSSFEWFGNKPEYYYNAHIGEINITEGDLIQLNVTNNPNDFEVNYEVEGDWFDIVLNDNPTIYNLEDVHIGLNNIIYGDFFTLPALFENDIGIFITLEEYYRYAKETEEYYNVIDYYTDSGDDYSVIINNTESCRFYLNDKLFTIVLTYNEFRSIEDNRYINEEESLLETFEFETSSVFDVERGVLYSYSYDVDYFYNFSSKIEEDIHEIYYYHLKIENLDQSIGYDNQIPIENENKPNNNIFGSSTDYIIIGMAVFTCLFAIFGVFYKRKKSRVSNPKNDRFFNEIAAAIQENDAPESKKQVNQYIKKISAVKSEN